MLLVVAWASFLKNLLHLENIKLEIKFLILSAVHVCICAVNGFKIILCWICTFKELYCCLLQKWKAISFDFSQEAELQLTFLILQTSWNVINADLNAFLSNVFKAFLIVNYLVLSIDGNLKNLKRILWRVSPTSFKDCLFYCRPAKKEQLKQQMLHGVLDGIVVRVIMELLSLCDLLQKLPVRGLNCCR